VILFRRSHGARVFIGEVAKAPGLLAELFGLGPAEVFTVDLRQRPICCPVRGLVSGDGQRLLGELTLTVRVKQPADIPPIHLRSAVQRSWDEVEQVLGFLFQPHLSRIVADFDAVDLLTESRARDAVRKEMGPRLVTCLSRQALELVSFDDVRFELAPEGEEEPYLPPLPAEGPWLDRWFERSRILLAAAEDLMMGSRQPSVVSSAEDRPDSGGLGSYEEGLAKALFPADDLTLSKPALAYRFTAQALSSLSVVRLVLGGEGVGALEWYALTGALTLLVLLIGGQTAVLESRLKRLRRSAGWEGPGAEEPTRRERRLLRSAARALLDVGAASLRRGAAHLGNLARDLSARRDGALLEEVVGLERVLRSLGSTLESPVLTQPVSTREDHGLRRSLVLIQALVLRSLRVHRCAASLAEEPGTDRDHVALEMERLNRLVREIQSDLGEQRGLLR
jgi:hypothetical protein